jgi:hypothetical protein
MKWHSTNKDSHQEVYELWDAKEKLLVLAYHPDSATLRISADNEKRVFLIGRKGFLRRRTVLRNEYGVRMGQLIDDTNLAKQGTIEIYKDGFTYVLQNDNKPKASIYRNAEMIIECELPDVSKNISSDNHDLLMLTLCWYISTSVKKQVIEYA